MATGTDMRARVIVPLVVALAFLMETTDATVLATALPVVARDLSVSVLSLKLALSSYLVAFAVMVPVSSWLADRHGARRIFVAAMVVFLLGSALSAMQSTLTGLVWSRSLQGAGGAMMVPVGRMIVVRGVAKSELVRALAWVTVPGLLGPALGPLVGALVTQSLGWRWVFLINLPIGLVAVALALALIPRLPPEPASRLDLPGFLASAVGLGGLLLGVSTLGEHLIPTWVAVGLMGLGVLALAAYARRARGRDDALLDLRLFRYRLFSIGLLSGTLFRMSGGAAAFLLPLLFQIGLGLSITVSGLLSGSFAFGGLTMRALAPAILDRFGFRRTLSAGTLLNALCFMALGLIQSTDLRVLLPLLIGAGFLQALIFTGLNGLVFAEPDGREVGSATSFSAVSQQVGLTLGISVAALVLQAGGDPSPAGAVHLSHFPAAFRTIALVLLLSILPLLRMHRGEAQMLHHQADRVGPQSQSDPRRKAQPGQV
ncbi:MAG: MFS transporter [Rhodobacteraceae bacterium]|nr:MFS transporter [Paracoccaceae bacterium]